MNADTPRRLARLAACLLVMGCASAAAAQSLTDALAAAYANSAELRTERARLKEVNERVPQALANTRPTIQAFGSVGTVHETSNIPVPTNPTAPSIEDGQVANNLSRRSYGVSISEPLYRGGRTVAEYREAHDLIAAERARLTSVEQHVFVEAATAYANVLAGEELYRLAAKREDVLRAQLVQAKGRFAEGAMVKTDLLATQAGYDAAVAQLASSRAQLAVARLAYTRDVGTPPATLAFPATSLPMPASIEEAEQRALDANPDLKSAEFTLAAGHQQVRDAAGQGLPTVALQGAVQHQEGLSFRGQVDDSEALVVQLRVPLYSGGLIASRIRTAKANEEAQRATLDRQRQTIVASVESAWQQVAAARASVAALEAQVQIDALSVEGVNAQYLGGERTRQEVLDAEQTLFQAQSGLVNARRDYLVYSVNMLAAVGDLTVRQLNLPVEAYDIERDYRKVHYGPGR